jgi:hypothetical protein
MGVDGLISKPPAHIQDQTYNTGPEFRIEAIILQICPIYIPLSLLCVTIKIGTTEKGVAYINIQS